jgi:hypothetical protein
MKALFINILFQPKVQVFHKITQNINMDITTNKDTESHK